MNDQLKVNTAQIAQTAIKIDDQNALIKQAIIDDETDMSNLGSFWEGKISADFTLSYNKYLSKQCETIPSVISLHSEYLREEVAL